jgi:hypothetical protein
MVSLTLYNRRQRELWIEKELRTLQDAKTAYASGSATEEQLELLKNEKIGEIYHQKKEEGKAQRPWNKLKRYLFEGLSTEDAAAAAPGKVESVGEGKPGILEALKAKPLEDAKADSVPVASGVPAPQPGQLDALAKNAEAAAKQTTRSWKSWFTGR